MAPLHRLRIFNNYLIQQAEILTNNSSPQDKRIYLRHLHEDKKIPTLILERTVDGLLTPEMLATVARYTGEGPIALFICLFVLYYIDLFYYRSFVDEQHRNPKNFGLNRPTGSKLQFVLKGPFTTNGACCRFVSKIEHIPKMFASFCRNIKYDHCPYFILQVRLANRYVSNFTNFDPP